MSQVTLPNHTTSFFCVILRAFSSETRAFSCHKVHNSHVVRSRRWSKVWSGQIPSPYLFSRIHSSRSSYFFSGRNCKINSRHDIYGRMDLILLTATFEHQIVFGTLFLSCVIIFNPLQRFPRSAYLSFHQSARAS